MDQPKSDLGNDVVRMRFTKWIVVPCLIFSFIVIPIGNVWAQDNYTFGSEAVNKGTSANPGNKNAEDASYNTLIEGDQYTDTNFSGSSENVVTGTAGGAAFSGALDTDDASRRTYTEAASGGGSPTIQVLRPTSDGSVNTMVEQPTSPTTHFDKADETTAGGDGDTTYLEGVTNAQESELGMSDPSDPGGSPNIDVIMWHISRGETTSSCTVVWGIEIGGVEYQGGSTSMVSITYANFSYEWTTNPAGGEWTLSTINGLETYVRVTDANPDTRTTQVGLVVEFNPTASYQLDAQITYSSVASTSQTTGFQVLCQGYRNGDIESINVQAWNYTSSAWVTKATISAGSDTDYNFNLLGWAANCERSSGNVVLLRLVDASNGDATQTVAYLDVLKVNRIEKGYASEVVLSSTTVPAYGNITVRIKGYTSAETWQVDVWNYTSSAYDTNKLQITSLSNAWQTTIDLCDGHHRSGQTVQMRLLDVTAASSDTTQDTFYLDVAWVSLYHTAPTASQDGCDPTTAYKGTTIHFWVIYTDYDNEAPSTGYPKVHIDSSDYTMTENETDTAYHDGKTYHFDKADLLQGVHDFYFILKDDSSGEITTSVKQLTIENREPAITNPLNDQTEYRNAPWEHDYEGSDPDSDTLEWELSTNASAWLSMNSGTGVLSGTTPALPGWFWVEVWGNDSYGGSDSDTFDFYVINQAPTITSSGNTTQTNNTYLAYDATATDPDSDALTWEFASNATWLSLEANSWVNGTAEVGIFWCKLWANDSYGGSDLEEWQITVTASEDPPEPPESPDDPPTDEGTVINYKVSFGFVAFIGIIAFMMAWVVVYVLK